jgi:hypothetical protein
MSDAEERLIPLTDRSTYRHGGQVADRERFLGAALFRG